MEKLPVTAIFDIGKTNKKFFLFDENLREVFQTYSRFEDLADEDGFPAENLPAMSKWMIETFQAALALPEFEIQQLNFSTHGASFVHTDHGRKSSYPTLRLP